MMKSEFIGQKHEHGPQNIYTDQHQHI